jgi:hypothetical protein
LGTPPGRCTSAVVVQSPDRLYGITNDHTVVVDRSNREIVHSC